MGSIRNVLVAAACCAMIPAVVAQKPKPAPVEDLGAKREAILQGQQRASVAYRELQQAQYDAKLAEQDYWQAEDAYRAAQQHADGLKRKLEAARKALDAAKAKEARARESYEQALGTVDKLWQKPQGK